MMPPSAESPAIALAKAQLRIAQACDQCNYRKIKCRIILAGDPCAGCVKSHLTCTRERPANKRGPKGPKGLVLPTEQYSVNLETTPGRSDSDPLDPTSTVANSTSFASSDATFVPAWNVSPPQSVEGLFGESSTDTLLPDFLQNLLPVGFWASYPSQQEILSTDLDWTALSSNVVEQPNAAKSPPKLLSSETFQDVLVDRLPPELPTAPDISLGEPECVVRVACAQRTAPHETGSLPEGAPQISHRLREYARVLAPYVPVVNSEELSKAYKSGKQDKSNLFRALLLSTLGLAATVGVGSIDVETATASEPSSPVKKQNQADRDMAMTYLENAQAALAMAVCNSEPTVAAVVTSMHLFMAWEWVREHKKSWLHLQAAISMAQSVGIDRIGSKPIPADVFFVTRLKLYYLLCIVERSHALLRPSSLVHTQALRLPGRPWTETRDLRDSLPPGALGGFQIRIIQALDNAGDKLIRCWRGLCGLKDPSRRCWEWTLDYALQLQDDLGRQMDDVSKWSWQPTPAGPDFEKLKMSNLAATIAWLRDLCWNVCRTHRLVSWDSAHPVLRYSFVLENLTQLLAAGPVEGDGFNQDVSLDSYAKLLDVTMTAIKTVEEFVNVPGGVDETNGAAERLRQELLVPVWKSVTLFTSALGTHSMTSTLVKAVATIC